MAVSFSLQVFARNLLRGNHRRNTFSRSFSLCQAIFIDVLDIKRAAARIFPKLLNFEQKQHRMDITQEMLTNFYGYPDLLEKVVTVGES